MPASSVRNNNLFRSLSYIEFKNWLITNESNSTIRAQIMLGTVLKLSVKKLGYKGSRSIYFLKMLPKEVLIKALDMPYQDAYEFFQHISSSLTPQEIVAGERDQKTTIAMADYCGYFGIDLARKANKQQCRNDNRTYCDFWEDHLTTSSGIANAKKHHISCNDLRYDIPFPPLNGGERAVEANNGTYYLLHL